MAVQTEERPDKPSLWSQALKVVKGESTAELVEQFTQEMTLVAEGLCEDQARLRKAMDGILRESENQRSAQDQDRKEMLRLLEESQKKTEQRLEELSQRISALEKPAPREKKARHALGGDLIGRITVLAGIVCGTWLMVTVLKLLM